jgi:hypothetical protein
MDLCVKPVLACSSRERTCVLRAIVVVSFGG